MKKMGEFIYLTAHLYDDSKGILFYSTLFYLVHV